MTAEYTTPCGPRCSAPARSQQTQTVTEFRSRAIAIHIPRYFVGAHNRSRNSDAIRAFDFGP